MALLSVQNVPLDGSLTVVFTAADAGLTEEYPNDGRTLLIARNTNASTRDVTITPTGDLGPLVTETGAAQTVPAISGSDPGLQVFGPLATNNFNAADGNVDVTSEASAGLSYAVVRLPKRP